MNGISMTSQPICFSVADSAPACFLARDTSTLHPASGLLVVIRYGCCGTTAFSPYTASRILSPPRRSNVSSDKLAQRDWIVPALLLAQDFRPIRTRNDSCQMQLAILHLGERANRYLTTSAELVQQRPLAHGRSARIRIVEEYEVLAHLRIAFAYLDAQRALPCCRTHELRSQIFLHQLRLAQSRQTRSGENDSVILSLFQLAHSRIHIAAQRMNHQV